MAILQAATHFADNLTITRHPAMLGVWFVTIGPLRPHRYWRQTNGGPILLDPATNHVFGFVYVESANSDSVLVLPITGTLTPLIPQ
jgi:hypothetical protein